MFSINFDFIEKCLRRFKRQSVAVQPTPSQIADAASQGATAVVQGNQVVYQRNTTGRPSTFEEAVDFVAASISPTTVSSPFFHLTGGMAIRNDLGLWQRDGALYQHMLTRFGLGHADDTGAIISNAAHAKVNGENYDPADDIQRFKEHWQRMGVDPATQERISV